MPKPGSACIESAQPGKAMLRQDGAGDEDDGGAGLGGVSEAGMERGRGRGSVIIR